MKKTNPSLILFIIFSLILQLVGCAATFNSNETTFSITSDDGVSAKLENVSYSSDNILSCTILVSVPPTIKLEGNTSKKRIDFCQQKYQPSLLFGEKEYSLTVISSQLHEEDENSIEYSFEGEASISLDSSDKNFIEIYLSSFEVPFHVSLDQII